MVQYFSSKRVGETITLTFNFSRLLGTGETINSATWSIEVVDGVDASPSSMISGSESISGSKVSQLVTGGVHDVVYRMVCAVTTSTGQIIHGTGLLKVDNGDA